jgi:hypothetical protein
VIKICFIIHGKHKNRKTHFDYIDACRTEQHFQTTIHYTEKQGDARYFASLEAEKGTEILIAVGGRWNRE